MRQLQVLCRVLTSPKFWFYYFTVMTVLFIGVQVVLSTFMGIRTDSPVRVALMCFTFSSAMLIPTVTGKPIKELLEMGNQSGGCDDGAPWGLIMIAVPLALLAGYLWLFQALRVIGLV